MYNKFFGFQDKPFQLVPNPRYLYLSRSHEEALAHLTYAVDQGDGFVEIIGEVGTGKTTLCRVLLESLDETTESAFIFNPKLDALQLLQVVNDEFGISSKPDNIKDLIDILNAFLIEKKKEGQGVIIIIDEAQNLSQDVLEQLRLLSNLETTASKLVQIILVGQPELGDMLDSYELRQLGQRITLSCHILPLSFKESCEYIDHRLHIASSRPNLTFQRGALKAIYSCSGGVPRLINILCHRALLVAFVQEKHIITRKMIQAAVNELAGSMKRPMGSWMKRGRGVVKESSAFWYASLALMLTAAFLIILWSVVKHDGVVLLPGPGGMTSQTGSTEKVTYQISSKVEETSQALAAGEDTPSSREKRGLLREFPAWIDSSLAARSKYTVMEEAFALWGEDREAGACSLDIEDDDIFFMVCSKQKGLYVHKLESGFDLVQKLDLPAIMEFSPADSSSPLYLLLKGSGNGSVLLGNADGKGGTFTMEMDVFDELWTGRAYVLWKDFSGCSGTIPMNAPEESVIVLKLLLRELGYEDMPISKNYDDETIKIIKTIQRNNGLDDDGYVGALTKIVLYNENKSLNIPHLINMNDFM